MSFAWTGSASWDALRRSRRVPAALLALALLGALAIHALAAVSAYDDAFITLRYVRHVVEGRGAVYNDGERVFGISTPLYAGWLCLLHAALPGVDLPALAARGNILFLASAGVLAYLLVLAAGGGRWSAALAGSMVLLSDGILRASIGGMESSLFLALGLGACLAALERRDFAALLLAGLTALVRPEGVLLVGLVVAARLSDPTTRSLPPRLWLTAIPPAIWVGFATLYYGSPIPHSVVAKARPLYPLPPGAALFNLVRHTGEWTLGGAQLLARSAASILGGGASPPSQTLLMVGGGAVTIAALAFWPHQARAGLRGVVLPSFFVVLMAFYALTNPYLLPWYFPLVQAPWLIVVAAAASRRQGAGSSRSLAGAAPALLAALTAFVLTLSHLPASDWSLLQRGASTAKQSEVLEAYGRTADWVEQNSRSDESVAAPEIGMIGYRLDRRILDACGLVTPEAVPFLPVPIDQRGSQPGVISVDFVRATSPDLVVTLPTFARPSLLRSDWFEAAYELIHEEPVLHGEAGQRGVLVYRKRIAPSEPGAPAGPRAAAGSR